MRSKDKEKEERHETAKIAVKRLNKRLPEKVYAEAAQSGKIYVYYEANKKAKKVRLLSAYGTPEFDEELAAAKRAIPAPVAKPSIYPQIRSAPAVNTWRSLCEDYFKRDTKFAGYTDQKRRTNDLRSTYDEKINPQSPFLFGDCPLERFGTQAVRTLVDRKLTTKTVKDSITGKDRVVISNREASNQRRKWIAMVLQFGIREGKVTQNFARDIERLAPENKSGFRTWTPQHRKIYEAAFPLGTLQRLVYDLALYTSARRGDVHRLGRQMLKKDSRGRDTLVYVQQKNHNENPITVFQPIFPELQASLDASKSILGDILYIVQVNGTKGYTKESLANNFRDWVIEAGLGDEGISLHGLRKAAVCNLIMKRCSVHEIMAITGHRSTREIERYGREYMREIAAEAVFDRWLETQDRDATFDEKAIISSLV